MQFTARGGRFYYVSVSESSEPPIDSDAILLEDDSFILLEDDGKILLEG